MKITALMIVIDEAEYVYYALKSIYDVVDEIIIVEGASIRRFVEGGGGQVTEEGLSVDSTKEEIERLIDEDIDHKVKYYQHGWVDNVGTLREICFSKVSLDTDYCLIVDADSVFHPKEIQGLRDWVDRYPNIGAIAVLELMFFWDFSHCLTVSPEKLELCNYMESGLFWKYLPDFVFVAQRPHQRPYGDSKNFLESLFVVDQNDVEEHKDQMINLVAPKGLFKSYHYGWVHRPEIMRYHILRWAHASLSTLREGKATESMKRWIVPMVGMDNEELWEYYQTYHKLWTGIFDETVEEHLEEFQGEHPPIMKTHPYYGKSKEELGW